MSQAVLLATSALFLVFATTLTLSLRRTVGLEFERAFNMLEALYRADEDLHRSVSSERVLQALVEVASTYLGAEKSILLVWEPAEELFVVRASHGYDEEALRAVAIGPGESSIAEVMRTGRCAVVADAARLDTASRCLVPSEKVGAMAHVPIRIADRIFGILSLCYARPRSFDGDDLRLLSALGGRAASAIENARLYEQMEEAATLEERQRLARELHDAVTQTLFSASLIAEVLPRIWQRAPDQGRQRLEELRQLTRGALAEMRALLLELRPASLAEARLGDLLHQLAEATTGRSRIPVSVLVQGPCDLPPAVKVSL